MKIHIAIPTYNRSTELSLLLKDFLIYKNDYELSFFIYDDASKVDYIDAINILKTANVRHVYKRNKANLGKQFYWKTHNTIYADARNEVFDYFIFITDDMRLTNNFIPNLIKMIVDTKQEIINYCTCTHHTKRFSERKMQIIKVNDISYWKNGWIDSAFIAKRSFLEAINYSIDPVDPVRWRMNPLMGSGCCRSTMKKYKKPVYQVCKSLVIHTGHESVLNPILRKTEKMISEL